MGCFLELLARLFFFLARLFCVLSLLSILISFAYIFLFIYSTDRPTDSPPNRTDVTHSLTRSLAPQVVYAAAALPVVFNKTEVTQRYVAGHSDAVTCLAMHPGGAFVASGQKGQLPCVLVADSLTGVVVGKFSPGEEQGGSDGSSYCAISAVAFSTDGKLLAFTAQDDGANTLFVYNWQEGALKAKVASGPLKVMALAFSPDSQTLLSCGVDHFSLWGVGGRGITKRRGIFGPSAVKQTLLSCCWVPPTGEDGATPGFAVLGAADGSIYKLEGRTVSQEDR